MLHLLNIGDAQGVRSILNIPGCYFVASSPGYQFSFSNKLHYSATNGGNKQKLDACRKLGAWYLKCWRSRDPEHFIETCPALQQTHSVLIEKVPHTAKTLINQQPPPFWFSNRVSTGRRQAHSKVYHWVRPYSPATATAHLRPTLVLL